MNLQEIAQRLRNLDVGMLTTITSNGLLASRPMSNNGNVEWDGTSCYFTYDDSRMVSDIEENPAVMVTFEGDDGLYIALQGTAELIDDEEQFEEMWEERFDKWFPQGPQTPGLIMIKVTAERVKFWQDEDSGECIL